MLESKRRIHVGEMGGALNTDGSEIGQIKIHPNVVASIVRKTACEINGVKRLGGGFVDNFAEILRSRRIGDRAIVVDMEGNNVAIEIKVNFHYGAHVPTVASNVQSSIISEVGRMTGLNVTGVTVIVQELEEAENEKE